MSVDCAGVAQGGQGVSRYERIYLDLRTAIGHTLILRDRQVFDGVVAWARQQTDCRVVGVTAPDPTTNRNAWDPAYTQHLHSQIDSGMHESLGEAINAFLWQNPAAHLMFCVPDVERYEARKAGVLALNAMHALRIGRAPRISMLALAERLYTPRSNIDSHSRIIRYPSPPGILERTLGGTLVEWTSPHHWAVAIDQARLQGLTLTADRWQIRHDALRIAVAQGRSTVVERLQALRAEFSASVFHDSGGNDLIVRHPDLAGGPPGSSGLAPGVWRVTSEDPKLVCQRVP
jgi:hypothetical protein